MFSSKLCKDHTEGAVQSLQVCLGSSYSFLLIRMCLCVILSWKFAVTDISHWNLQIWNLLFLALTFAGPSWSPRSSWPSRPKRWWLWLWLRRGLLQGWPASLTTFSQTQGLWSWCYSEIPQQPDRDPSYPWRLKEEPSSHMPWLETQPPRVEQR